MDCREKILNVAEHLYDSIGFEKETIGDIARVLGMSPANLYRSFLNRHAGTMAGVGQFIRDLRGGLRHIVIEGQNAGVFAAGYPDVIAGALSASEAGERLHAAEA